MPKRRVASWMSCLLLLGACGEVPIVSPLPPQGRVRTGVAPLAPTTKVDVLFVLDDTSEPAVLGEVRNRFSKLFAQLSRLADKGHFADIHLGVISADYGAGVRGSPGCTPSGPNGGGDQGKLVAVGKKASPNCQPPVGANYIAFKYGPSPDPANSNLPANQGVIETAECMAAVGTGGCRFPAPLESAYAALRGNLAENAGFLRDDALLAVIFVTQKDDGSAPPNADIYDSAPVGQYGYFGNYSRQTRSGIVCGNPPIPPPYESSKGVLTGCFPAPNPDGTSGPGKLYDVQRYINLFAMPRVQGGLKDNPLDVILIGIDGPSEPVQVILSDPSTPIATPYVECSTLSETGNPPCLPVLQHSCSNPANRALTGDPAVRLNAVISSVKQYSTGSICDNDYGPIISSVGLMIASRLRPYCMLDRFPTDAQGQRVIDCDVTLSVPNADGSESKQPLPACVPLGTVTPCWHFVEDDDQCAGLSAEGLRFVVEFGSVNGKPVDPPPRSNAIFQCATLAP